MDEANREYYQNDWTLVLASAAQILYDRGVLNVSEEEAPVLIYEALFDALRDYGSGAALIFIKDLKAILEEEYERGLNDR